MFPKKEAGSKCQLTGDAVVKKITLGDPRTGEPDVLLIDVAGQTIRVEMDHRLGGVLNAEQVRKAALVQCGALLIWPFDDSPARIARRDWREMLSDAIAAGQPLEGPR